jgi:hypothetical protein
MSPSPCLADAGRIALVACLALGLQDRDGNRSAVSSTARETMRAAARITDAEWAALSRGEVVAKVLETDSREVAVAGAVRIGASIDRLVARYQDIDNLKRSAIVIEVGRFGEPPRPADLMRAPLEEYNLDLRDCQPFDCRVRLGEAEIARFHREVNWNAPDWRTRSASLWRDVLAGYAAAYLREGRHALPIFANKREPLSVASELELLVPHFAFVAPFSPPFFGYLREFGARVPDGAEHVLYWTKEDFGIRPVTRISHQTIYRVSAKPSALLIATNQVYADHYLDAALTVTTAIEADDNRGQGFYLVAVGRARTRSLSGLLRTLVRSTVQNRSREAMRKILTATKANLEKPGI